MDFIYKPTTAVAFVMNDVPEEEVGNNQPGMDALEWKEGLKPKSAALFYYISILPLIRTTRPLETRLVCSPLERTRAQYSRNETD